MKQMKLAFGIIAAAFILACNKVEISEKTYARAQTQCADNWANGDTDAKTIQNMVDYLRSKGIEVSNARLKKSSSDLVVCLACSCTTGKSFFIDLEQGSVSDLEKEGFRKVN